MSTSCCVFIDGSNKAVDASCLIWCDQISIPEQGKGGNQTLTMSIEIEDPNSRSQHSIEALIDSGANVSIIDNNFALRCCLTFHCLSKPIPLSNSDGTANGEDPITHFVSLVIHFPHGHRELHHF